MVTKLPKRRIFKCSFNLKFSFDPRLDSLDWLGNLRLEIVRVTLAGAILSDRRTCHPTDGNLKPEARGRLRRRDAAADNDCIQT